MATFFRPLTERVMDRRRLRDHFQTERRRYLAATRFHETERETRLAARHVRGMRDHRMQQQHRRPVRQELPRTSET